MRWRTRRTIAGGALLRIAGLVASTVLSLIVMPVIYRLVMRK